MIVPKPSMIVIFGGGFLMVIFAIIVVCWFLQPSSRSESGASVSVPSGSGVYALGSGDAVSLYGRGDMENAIQAAKISRRIESDSEYERGFRDQWRYLDNKDAIEYQRAKGR